MTTVVPQSELLRRAIAHVSQAQEAAAVCGDALRALVEDACVRFNLSPLDSEFLMQFFMKPQGRPDAEC